MKKYKIEITKTYCVDIEAKGETEQNILTEQAEAILDQKMLAGTEHYLQTNDTEFYVYDVTDTEDPFHPNN